jgi:hypothetical protein
MKFIFILGGCAIFFGTLGFIGCAAAIIAAHMYQEM